MKSKSDVISVIHCSYDQLGTKAAKPIPINSHTDHEPNQACLIKAMNGSSSSPPDRDLPHSRKSKRRVRFPDGEVISNYLEPFRPVPDNCTSDELIAAYLEACFQNKVSPIEFLLEQLKGIDLSICNERYSRLSLKGIRLNRSHVETLEEIFRRVHFRELDFEGTFLDDQSAVALFDMLLHYETCHELHISLNLDRFHPSLAWARCVTFMRRSGELRRFALSHTPLTIGNFLGLNFFGLCLNSLSLRDCNLSGQALFGLVRWLRLLLSSASLEPPSRDKNSGSSGNGSRAGSRRSGSSGAGSSSVVRRSHLWRSVLTVNPKTGMRQPSVWDLKLDLAQNRLNATDAETLLALIRHQLLVPQIPPDTADLTSSSTPSTEPNLSQEEPVGLKKEWLPVGGIGFLSDLDLSSNSLGDDGLRVVCTGLLQSYRTRLRDLHAEAPATTGEEVKTSDTSVTCSSPGDPNDTVSSEAQESSAPVQLDTSIRGLERLSVANNGLTANGMQAMALVLMQTPLSLVHLVGGLVSLDLSNNPGIGDEGVEILCEGLIRNHSLKQLHLRAIRMSFTGIFALSSFLSEAKCLCLLDIRSNHMNLAALMALSKTLSLNKTLTSLLSDARSMTSTEDPLIATDAELILYLIDEIDKCLRRNRMLQQTLPTPTPKQTEVPSSTSTSVTDIESASSVPATPDLKPGQTENHNPASSDSLDPDKPDTEPDLSETDSEVPVTSHWSDKTLVELRSSVELSESPLNLCASSFDSSVESPFQDSAEPVPWNSVPAETSSSAERDSLGFISPDPEPPALGDTDFSWDFEKPVDLEPDAGEMLDDDLPYATELDSSQNTDSAGCTDFHPTVVSGADGDGMTQTSPRKHVQSNPSGNPVAI